MSFLRYFHLVTFYIDLKPHHPTTFHNISNEIIMPFTIYNPFTMRTLNILCIFEFFFHIKMMIIKI